MKLIKTQEAIGHVLCHDLTQIIPGEFKGARFRKGHEGEKTVTVAVRPEDILLLQKS